ncbi:MULTISPECIES: hypothetical protein [unclassified Bradyrhizobium]
MLTEGRRSPSTSRVANNAASISSHHIRRPNCSITFGMIAEYRIDRIRRRVIAIRAKKGCDFIIFMANISLGPDDAKRLEYHDVSIVNDREAGERILEIEVRGKRGVCYCKSMPSMPLRPSCGSARETRPSRPPLVPEQPVFPPNTILEKQELKFDREGSAARPAVRGTRTSACG